MILNKDKILQVKSDRLFHDLFNEKEMDTIEWTVMQILDKNYEEIHGKVYVSNIRIPTLSKTDKQKYLDLVVKLDNETIVIELNNNSMFNYTRNLMYVFSTLVNEYTAGDTYYETNHSAILVNLNWLYNNENLKKYDIPKEEIIYPYPLLKNEDKYIIKIINVNLDFYNKICYDDINKRDVLWKLLTIDNKEELDKIIKQEKLLKNYENKLIRLSGSEDYCKMVWDERIEENLRKFDAYHDGLDEGAIQKETEMIINMHNKGIDSHLIAEIANLSIDEVEKIIKKNLNLDSK